MRPIAEPVSAGCTTSGVIYGRDARKDLLFATIQSRMGVRDTFVIGKFEICLSQDYFRVRLSDEVFRLILTSFFV
jgi:hypothetical protein